MPINERITERIPKKTDQPSLQPCPCCGSDDVSMHETGFDMDVIVVCQNCGLNTGMKSARTLAVGVWNRRK